MLKYDNLRIQSPDSLGSLTFDEGAVKELANRGPDKDSFGSSLDYEAALGVHNSSTDAARNRWARQQLSGACLLNEVSGGITSGTATRCGNDGCLAYRKDSKDEIIHNAGECLTDARS